MATQVTNTENEETKNSSMLQNAFDLQIANSTERQVEKTNDASTKNSVLESPITSNDVQNTPQDGLEYLNALRVVFPEYGVEQYINDKTIWQKQLYTIGGEQGFFYFKIFFNFKTSHGLLADLLTDDKKPFSGSKNSAIYYLAANEHRYKQEQLTHRKLALYKFGSTLHSIEIETPWVFKGVNQLDTLDTANFSNLGKTREIEILFNNETVDMRIGTLLDLYKYACYDTINMKEIIPANLRKFDMFILTFHVPIKNFQTNISTTTDGAKSIPAKTTNLDSKSLFSNMLSYKMYTFVNCEIDPASLNLYTPNQLNNETAFVMGNNVLKIIADRVYEHRMNEWTQFMFGDDGFYYNRFSPTVYIGDGNLSGTGAVAGDAPTSKDLIINEGGEDYNKNRLSTLQSIGTVRDYTDRMIRDLNNDKTEWSKFSTEGSGREGEPNTKYRNNTEYLNKKIKELHKGKKLNIQGGKNLTRTGNPGLSRRNTSYLNRKLKNLHKGTLGKKIPFPQSIWEGIKGGASDLIANFGSLF